MFDKEALDVLWAEIEEKFKSGREWEQLMRDAHLGIARSDAGVDLGNIDKRVIEVINRHAK